MEIKLSYFHFLIDLQGLVSLKPEALSFFCRFRWIDIFLFEC